MNSLKAITIGDINGIGLELLLNLYKNKNKNDFVLFTDINKFNDYINKNKIKIKTNHINYCKKKSVYNKKLFNTLEDIISYLKDSNKKNILFSPGYPSGKDYKNFEIRGEHFNSCLNQDE